MALETNLTHAWNLIADSNDSKGTDNGTDSNVSYSSPVSGYANFNGSTSKSVLGTALALPSALTIFAWVKLAGTGGNCVVIGDSDATNTEQWSLRLISDGTVRLTWATGAGGAAIYGTDSAVINDTNLHSVMVTQTGSSAPIFYIDGSLVASSLVFGSAANPKPTAQSTAIGEYGGFTGGLQWMNGAIRLLCTWDAVKSSGDATTLHNGGVPGSFNGSVFVFAVNYSLVCDQGAFTLTGQTLTINKTLTIILNYGSFALTGIATALQRGYTLVADFGAFALSGQSVDFTKQWIMILAQGSFTLAGQTVTFTRNVIMTLETGFFTFTGQIIRILRNGSPEVWINSVKSAVSSMTNLAKNVASMTNQAKSAVSTWINQDKN